MKKKIIFLIPALKVGGAERVFLHLLKGFDRERFKPILLLARREGLFLKEVPGDVPVHVFGASKSIVTYFNLIRFISKIRPDAIISTLGLILPLAIIRFLLPGKIRFVARETNMPSMKIFRYRLPAVYMKLYQMFFPKYDDIVCLSQAMKNDFVKFLGSGAENYEVINNPIDFKAIQKSMNHEKNPFDPGRFNVIAVGRFIHQKGYDRLLEVIYRLRGENIHFTFIGEGRLHDYIIALSKTMGLSQQTSFVGFQSNPYPYMKFADLLILTSRYEGFPNVAIEANACGCPVLAYKNLSGIEEIIVEGFNGWTVTEDTIDAFEIQVRKIFAKHNLVNKEDIVKHTLKRFDIETIIARYQNVVDKS